ncbi:MAG: hypothetical protein SPI77_01070 [Corynebacterium sp.]|nr:hypothetical protein [Corynebacterium sp.]
MSSTNGTTQRLERYFTRNQCTDRHHSRRPSNSWKDKSLKIIRYDSSKELRQRPNITIVGGLQRIQVRSALLFQYDNGR